MRGKAEQSEGGAPDATGEEGLLKTKKIGIRKK
jgi:hypothetical protein